MFFDYDSSWIFPTTSPLSRTVVISDSMYQEYKQSQAKQEITLLESKLNRYKAAIAELEQEIKKIQETTGLLPEPKE